MMLRLVDLAMMLRRLLVWIAKVLFRLDERLSRWVEYRLGLRDLESSLDHLERTGGDDG